MTRDELLELLQHAPLIASAQASPGSPLSDPLILLRLAEASLRQGCRLIRAEGVASMRLIKERTGCAMIGLVKREYKGSPVYITPTRAEVAEVVETGADIVALDATLRPRPQVATFRELADLVHRAGRLVMADCDTLEAAQRALADGADVIGTTLAGYTENRAATPGPDLDLLRELAKLEVPVLAEGRYQEPWQARAALCAGADGVVIGGALNDPVKQTRRFMQAVQPPDGPVGAVDIGGTWIRFGVLSPEGALIHSERERLPQSRQERLDWIESRMRQHHLQKVGIGAGGVIDPDKNVVIQAKGFIVDYVGTEFCWPAFESVALNDGHAHAWGHACHPLFAGKRVCSLAFGTGVGCGVVDRGRLLMSRTGEPPHLNDLRLMGEETIEEVLGGLSLAQDKSPDSREQAVKAAKAAVDAARNMWHPDVIVISGGVGLSEWMNQALGGEPDVYPSPYGEDAGLIGAGWLVLRPPEEHNG